MSQPRKELYLNVIDELMRCPNGEEPNVLDQHLDLIDEGFVSMLLQVSTMLTHEGNNDGAQFLVFIARQLAHQLGLYPKLSTSKTPAQ
ncbi:MAG: hypothetical protein DSM107014_07925 [Gomphosphaeria aponina SAG 52.96 = DSM 107014]|uniref:Uncharacterized protein n=1 Tax=Gomphosphaeria aponina SAG 52.96 = DSM 107014 TaxID=1521640 RepID=A0A941JPM7_9CHRO|nr:hypothetical protein [Gomphosphaeria aponina SAG 52.96 = DSM 107014]